MLCQEWMVQDLKEKVQEQVAEWAAVKKMLIKRILPEQAGDQVSAVNPGEAGDREEVSKAIHKNNNSGKMNPA